MGLLSTLQKMKELASSAEKETDKIVFKLQKLDGNMPGIVREVAIAMAPMIRAQMRASLASSGLQNRSGGLEGAVENCRIVVSEKGFRIEIDEAKIIKQAAAQNYGWVSGQAGRRLKKLVKAGKAKHSSLKSHPSHKFLFLSSSQVAMLDNIFQKMVQLKIDRAMRG